MIINAQTQLFEDISDDEAEQMLVWARNVVLHGEFPALDPPWMAEWLKTFGYDERQRLMMINTALPQRVLLSLCERQR
jgi:hypothetical protein